MSETDQYLSEPNLPPAGLIRRVRETPQIENFFVGLPDSRVARPRNILLFCSGRKELEACAAEASHQRHLLILNLETEGIVVLDGLFVRVRPAQALLVFPFQAHKYLLGVAERVTWLFVSFELSESEALDRLRNHPVHVPAELWPFVDSLVAEYWRALLLKETLGEAMALLSYCLLRLLRECRQVERWPGPVQLADPSHQVVQRALQHIDMHFREGAVSVAQVAESVSVSQGHLRACFRRVLGMPVTTYVRRTRVHLACSLLSRTESNITQIADRCGFGSVYAFSRAFKREIGMAPTSYRNHLWQSRNLRD